MATNVTEKDKTLQEVIDWCEQLNVRLYAKPEDDIYDGEYAILFQLYLDGYVLSRTGRNTAQDQSEDAKG